MFSEAPKPEKRFIEDKVFVIERDDYGQIV
jgi:hypothetical protein